MWQPLPQGIAEVKAMLNQAVDPQASTITLNQAQARLKQLTETQPEFLLYLTYIFTTRSTIRSETFMRALAGILLKNELLRNWQGISIETLQYIHDSTPSCLSDSEKLIRACSGRVIATLIAKTALLRNGSRILDSLKTCVIQEENDFLADGASLAMLYIAEDAASILDSDEAGRPLINLIPFWIEQTNHIKPLLRERALDCILIFFPTTPRALHSNIPQLLRALSQLNNDSSSRVRERVVRVLYSLLEYFPEQIDDTLFSNITGFCLKAMDDDDQDVAKEGCEFFDIALREDLNFADLLFPFLPKLIPSLMNKMIYTEDDISDLESEVQIDSHVPDFAHEIKPFIGTGSIGMQSPQELMRQVDDEDGDDSDMHGDDGPFWTTRRRASLALDSLAKKNGFT